MLVEKTSWYKVRLKGNRTDGPYWSYWNQDGKPNIFINDAPYQPIFYAYSKTTDGIFIFKNYRELWNKYSYGAYILEAGINVVAPIWEFIQKEGLDTILCIYRGPNHMLDCTKEIVAFRYDQVYSPFYERKERFNAIIDLIEPTNNVLLQNDLKAREYAPKEPFLCVTQKFNDSYYLTEHWESEPHLVLGNHIIFMTEPRGKLISIRLNDKAILWQTDGEYDLATHWLIQSFEDNIEGQYISAIYLVAEHPLLDSLS